MNMADVTTPIKTFLSLWKRLMSGCPLIKADYRIEKVITSNITLSTYMSCLAHEQNICSKFNLEQNRIIF